MVALALLGGVFGMLIGSFLNVVVHRVPRGLSVVAPPSACGGCGTRIRWYDNVPVLSWLLLRARCRDCGSRISVRYPLLELGTGVAFAVVVLSMPPVAAVDLPAVLGGAASAVAFLYLAAITIALAAIDLDVKRLPDAIVLPAYPVGLVLLGAASLVAGDPWALARAGAGAGISFALYLALALVSPGGMGFGDVKLAGVLGLFLAWLGWPALIVGTFAPFLLGGAFAVLLLLRGAGRRTAVPFGPWMLGGAWIAILAGGGIWTTYLRMTGLA
jgi:leader peptidase (prepilin peptidase)/N-methyltransferase